MRHETTTRSRARGARVGFTLIELLVVIAIISLLISIILPAVSAAREEGKIAKCGAALHQIGAAIEMCHSEYGFFPMWDDGERSTVNDRIIATWIDALKHRRFIGVDAGYCPSDNLPDFLNEQRGVAWGFNYPPPISGRQTGGVDYSYGISVPLASGAMYSNNSYTYNGQAVATKILLQQNITGRVLAGDAFWDWIHNMSSDALLSNEFDTPNWFSSTAGFRHGVTTAKNPSGNFLKQDLHVDRVYYNVQRPNNPVDTSQHFITYAGEPRDVYPALGTMPNGSPPCQNFPKAIDPYEITGPNASAQQWIPEIRYRKGWD